MSEDRRDEIRAHRHFRQFTEIVNRWFKPGMPNSGLAVECLYDYARTSLSDLVQEAARDLPDGYRIKIDVEHEAGGVSLIGPCYGEIIDYPSNHETLEESFRDALTYAKELDDPNQSSEQA